jgi:hypothetical protein
MGVEKLFLPKFAKMKLRQDSHRAFGDGESGLAMGAQENLWPK